MARDLAIRIVFPEAHTADTRHMARAITVEVIDAHTRDHVGVLWVTEIKSRWRLDEVMGIQIVTPNFEVVDPATQGEDA